MKPFRRSLRFAFSFLFVLGTLSRALVAGAYDGYIEAISKSWGIADKLIREDEALLLLTSGNQEMGYLLIRLKNAAPVEALNRGGSLGPMLSEGAWKVTNGMPWWEANIYLRDPGNSLLEHLMSAILGKSGGGGALGTIGMRDVDDVMGILDHEITHWFQRGNPEVFAYQSNMFNRLLKGGTKELAQKLTSTDRYRGLNLIDEIEAHATKNLDGHTDRFKAIYSELVTEARAARPDVRKIKLLIGRGQSLLAEAGYKVGGKGARKSALRWLMKIHR